MQQVQRPGQGREDIVRRSAGLPYAICALFLAEPPRLHKVCGKNQKFLSVLFEPALTGQL